MFELWLDGRLLLMASPNAMSGGSASDERFAQPNLNNAGVLVLDPSHPFMRDHYEASDTCTELLHTEAGFEEGAAVDVFGFSRKALLDFSCDAEELLVLLHRHPFSPTVHLRDFDWTPEMVKQCLEEEKATGDDDGDWDCHDEILEMLDQGPYQSVNTDSGGVRFKVPSESSIGKMTRVIQSCLAIMAYQAAWIRKDLDQAMLVPSIRPKILSDIPLEDQADSMNDFGLSKDSKGLARAAPKAYRGVTRESLYEAGQWMEDPDRLALGVGITLEDRLEVDPEHPEFAKILRRGGSGKAISEAVEKSTRTLTFVRFKDLGTGASLEAAELGEGVSQVLPVACVALLDTINPYLRLMQQPELHLHPRIEARLADLLVYGMKKSRLHLSEDVARHSERILVETHSEHLILRICRRIRESTRGRIGAEVGLMLDELAVMGKSRTERDCSSDEEKRKFDSVIEDELATWIKPDDVAVIYAEPTPEGTVYHHLRIDEDGEFIDPWPDGFFPERAEELRP